MWIEVKLTDSPREMLWFGPGGVIAVSPGVIGTLLVFSQGQEMTVDNDYSWIKAMLMHSNPTNPSH